jgi:hypothetical protein
MFLQLLFYQRLTWFSLKVQMESNSFSYVYYNRNFLTFGGAESSQISTSSYKNRFHMAMDQGHIPPARSCPQRGHTLRLRPRSPLCGEEPCPLGLHMSGLDMTLNHCYSSL